MKKETPHQEVADRAKTLLRQLQSDEAERLSRMSELMARLQTGYFDQPEVVEEIAEQLLGEVDLDP